MAVLDFHHIATRFDLFMILSGFGLELGLYLISVHLFDRFGNEEKCGGVGFRV